MKYLLLVLLVATSVAAQTDKTADKKTGTEPAATAAKKHVKTEAVKAQKAAPAKTKSPEESTAEAQAETKKQPGQAEVAQAKTEAGPEEEPQAQTDPKLTSVPGSKALGMSILGNQEAPTSLVIVPWKSSEVGRATGISPMLDDSRQPVDKEVFMRELRYYEIRSEKKP
jgi:cell wall-associated NlpC family hydrolase